MDLGTCTPMILDPCAVAAAAAIAVCPTDFPFRFLDFASAGTATTVPTATILDKCAPANEVSSCPPFAAPTTGLPTMYYKPGFTRSTLTACIKYYTAPFNTPAGTLPVCPAAYPLVAITRPDPTAVTAQDQVLGCYSSDSTCIVNSPARPFSLVPSTGTGYCVPQIIGLQTCGGYPGERTGGGGSTSASCDVSRRHTNNSVNCTPLVAVASHTVI
jgi:hypothetical protein